jgi:hypothetical protein
MALPPRCSPQSPAGRLAARTAHGSDRRRRCDTRRSIRIDPAKRFALA